MSTQDQLFEQLEVIAEISAFDQLWQVSVIASATFPNNIDNGIVNDVSY